MTKSPWRKKAVTLCGVLLCVFTLSEVNYPLLQPTPRVAVFAMFGLLIIFLSKPLHERLAHKTWAQILDMVFALATIACFGYIAVQNQPLFESLWTGSRSLGSRAGMETGVDIAVAMVGLLVVLEATRRAIGWTLPLLSLSFIAYAYWGQSLPNWLFPHRGFSLERIVSQTFLQSQGVFGIALNVMFTYVFLFVIFGALLERTGATGFIIDLARRLFANATGGPAKVAVLSSGMMGSLSGSAVANTATTGTFTIPMMRSAGFKPVTAAAVEAAASSGGALVPPVMGAGAYMMLEIVDPPVTYLEIIKAALIPAVLYYVALLMIVHFTAKRIGASGDPEIEKQAKDPAAFYKGMVFFGSFAVLILFLLLGYTPFRAVTLSLLSILVFSLFHADTRLRLSDLVKALDKSAVSGVSLIAAACAVGIIIGVVTLTGVGAKLPSILLPLAEQNLILALMLLMVCTIILGMGLPSAVCYLLLATLVGPMLTQLGVVPLAAHLFIFYFGMMSMVTPPVALAAYTAGTIANTDIMKTGVAAFRFALVGFTLPYAFVLKPGLLMLGPDGNPASIFAIVIATTWTLLGIIPLATAIAGFAFQVMVPWRRALLLLISFVFLLVPLKAHFLWLHSMAFITLITLFWLNHRHRPRVPT